ncbi:hypothetical protein BCD48_16730 [Pseudofrankia sp. BMG5.36]|nr:hypothetical protein BCD48_16730 [Pseudofrankia sp. BMG5.36]
MRSLRKVDRHPAIFATYAALSTGGSFVLVNDHDPRHLRAELETEHAGGFDWEYLNSEQRHWRIRITKRASTPLPRVLVNTGDLAAGTGEPDLAGAVWKLPVGERDLDSNVIALPPGGTIEAHRGPDVDVLVHVLAGSGTLSTERGTFDLAPGALLWLPRRSLRRLAADDEGLRYLTVHRRRQALVVGTAPPPAN